MKFQQLFQHSYCGPYGPPPLVVRVWKTFVGIGLTSWYLVPCGETAVKDNITSTKTIIKKKSLSLESKICVFKIFSFYPNMFLISSTVIWLMKYFYQNKHILKPDFQVTQCLNTQEKLCWCYDISIHFIYKGWVLENLLCPYLVFLISWSDCIGSLKLLCLSPLIHP